MLKIFKKTKAKILLIILVVVAIGGAVFVIVRASSTYVADSFTDETKIGKGTTGVYVDTSNGQVKLPECYTASPSWSKVADTNVRDISADYNVTVAKDIYCDDNNCILYTNEEIPPSVVCIATNSGVYANILWAKADSSAGTWGPSGTGISGGDIGGTHGNINVGNNSVSVNSKKWLERYYASASGTYAAMDTCKAKGSGWRLPNILELDSIRDQGKGTAPYTYLPGIASYYWSSTEYSSTNAYSLYFNDGSVHDYDKTYNFSVRCVRGQ